MLSKACDQGNQGRGTPSVFLPSWGLSYFLCVKHLQWFANVEEGLMQAIREAATWSGYSYHRCKGVFFLHFFFLLSYFQFWGGAKGHQHAERKTGEVVLRDLHGHEGQDTEQGALCRAQHGPAKVNYSALQGVLLTVPPLKQKYLGKRHYEVPLLPNLFSRLSFQYKSKSN